MSTDTIEKVDTGTGEVIEALVVKKDDMLALVKDADKGVYNALSTMATLDWKNLPPPQTALLLMQRPMNVSGGGTMFLNFKQALLFAVRCYELGLSPFSDNVWFDPGRSAVNLTLAGKRELCRIRNIELGPPSFEETTREWTSVPKVTEAGEAAKKLGFVKDVGCKCTMRVGDAKNNEHVNFTAWLNDWFQPRSPVWQQKYAHMLAIRSNEKCITLILGTGISAMPDDKEIE